MEGAGERRESIGGPAVIGLARSRIQEHRFAPEDSRCPIREMFAGTWKSPGKSQSEKEREASNAVSNNMIPMNVNANANFTGVHPMIPKPAANVPKPPANAK